MNSNTTKTFRLSAGAGILLCTALAASAAGNSIVTFSVDMTGPIQNSLFTPGTTHVYVRGSFNNWSTGANYDGTGSSELTNNPSAANPNIYSGTFSDTNDANGAILNYKFYYNPGDTWEGVDNRTWGLPTASGGTLVLPTYYFNNATPTGQSQVTNAITFQVDMTQQIVLGNFIPGTSHVFARGSFNNWGNDASPTSPFPLTNNPAGPNTNLYTGTYYGPTGVEGGYVADHGSIQAYKYYIDTPEAWESPSAQSVDNTGNRRFNMLEADGTLVLPQVYFNDLPPVPPVTNFITFQVDMTVQASLGRFTPPPNGIDVVQVRGSFNNWSTGIELTNNPPPYTNKYSTVLGITNNPGTVIYYKFWDTMFPGNYETPTSTGGGNRSVALLTTNGSFTIPDVLFSDQQLGDITPTNTVVTFSVNMNGAVLTDSHVFDPNFDTVYLNGDFLGWRTWDTASLPQLTENPPGSGIYTVDQTIPAGNALALTYKFGVSEGGLTTGLDNEAGFGQNHVRYIRTGTAYTLPTDKFANMYGEPGTGNVTINPPSGGHVLVGWLGHPGISLAVKSSLTGGAWQNLPATDGATWTNGIMTTNGLVSTTNYPTSDSQTYFRWVKPATVPLP
jgi:hypothetical protein